MNKSIDHLPQERLKGQLLCTLAMVLVGTTVPVSKLIGQTLDPFVATALRHAAALPVLLIGLLIQSTPWPRLCRHDQILLALQSAAGSVGYTVLLISGVQLASAADASVVTGTLPAMAALLSFLFLGERPTLRSAACILPPAWQAGRPVRGAAACGPWTGPLRCVFPGRLSQRRTARYRVPWQQAAPWQGPRGTPVRRECNCGWAWEWWNKRRLSMTAFSAAAAFRGAMTHGGQGA